MNVHGGHLLPRFDWDLGIGVRRGGGGRKIAQGFQGSTSEAGVGIQLNLHRDTQKAGNKPDLLLLCYCTRAFDSVIPMCVLTQSQGLYGTRNMGALSVKTSGEVSFYERYIENSNWKEHVFQYQVEQL
ncbi:hypothetical protein BHM03_00036708 [Ensete ventricosum]|nr:hypothetical protein BHM03_00036708 [Ensete ventricosum]